MTQKRSSHKIRIFRTSPCTKKIKGSDIYSNMDKLKKYKSQATLYSHSSHKFQMYGFVTDDPARGRRIYKN